LKRKRKRTPVATKKNLYSNFTHTLTAAAEEHPAKRALPAVMEVEVEAVVEVEAEVEVEVEVPLTVRPAQPPS
jgi:hypothetical protein